MAEFMVKIELSGAAFEDSGEVSRILRKLADRVEIQVVADDEEGQIAHNGGLVIEPHGGWALHDVNGQRVGDAWIQEASDG